MAWFQQIDKVSCLAQVRVAFAVAKEFVIRGVWARKIDLLVTGASYLLVLCIYTEYLAEPLDEVMNRAIEHILTGLAAHLTKAWILALSAVASKVIVLLKVCALWWLFYLGQAVRAFVRASLSMAEAAGKLLSQPARASIAVAILAAVTTVSLTDRTFTRAPPVGSLVDPRSSPLGPDQLQVPSSGPTVRLEEHRSDLSKLPPPNIEPTSVRPIMNVEPIAVRPALIDWSAMMQLAKSAKQAQETMRLAESAKQFQETMKLVESVRRTEKLMESVRSTQEIMRVTESIRQMRLSGGP